MKCLSLVLLIVIGFAERSHAITQYYKENLPYQWMSQSNRFYHQLDFKFSPRFVKHYGADYRLTYSLGAQAIDLQGSYLKTTWGALSVPPSNSHIGGDSEGILTDPNSQLSVPRSDTDPWTQWIVELGYSYRGRLIPLDATRWIQAARVSLGYTGIRDTLHALGFSGITLNAEFSLWYPIRPKIMMGPTLGYRHGWVNLDGAPKSNLNRLPIATLEAALGLCFQI